MKKLRKEKNVKKETAHENAINVNSIKKSISGKEKVKSEKVEKKSKIRWLWLLNPNNLAKEIHVYGYDFSWLTHVRNAKIKIYFKKVKGHSGVRGNEKADMLAKMAVGVV